MSSLDAEAAANRARNGHVGTPVDNAENPGMWTDDRSPELLVGFHFQLDYLIRDLIVLERCSALYPRNLSVPMHRR